MEEETNMEEGNSVGKKPAKRRRAPKKKRNRGKHQSIGYWLRVNMDLTGLGAGSLRRRNCLSAFSPYIGIFIYVYSLSGQSC